MLVFVHMQTFIIQVSWFGTKPYRKKSWHGSERRSEFLPNVWNGKKPLNWCVSPYTCHPSDSTPSLSLFLSSGLFERLRVFREAHVFRSASGLSKKLRRRKSEKLPESSAKKRRSKFDQRNTISLPVSTMKDNNCWFF